MEALIYSIVKFVHIFSAILGAGGAFASDFIFLKSHKDNIISKDEFGILSGMSRVVWSGLSLLVVSGAVLFGMKYDVLLASSGFLAKVTLIVIVIVNGVFFHYLHIPYIQKHLNHHLFPKNKKPSSDFFVFSGVLSLISWMSIIAISSLKNILPISYLGYMGIYFFALSVASIFTLLIMKSRIHEKEVKTLKRAFLITLILALVSGGFIYFNNQPDKVEQKTPPVSQVSENLPKYSISEISSHNTNENCWVIVDDLVFDVTVAASHSGAFHCGQDVSVNYHRNHGAVIRPQMLTFKIGEVDKGSESSKNNLEIKNESLDPKLVWLGAQVAYDPKDLIFVIEKNRGSIQIIDGSAHVAIARLEGVGFQPHGVVYSQDLKFAYSISRDGWLVKFDLETLQPIKWERFGLSSRGIALTDNGKYIAVGNYEPETFVVINTTDLTKKFEIDLVDLVDGKEVRSRAGAIVEKGDVFITALKDLNAVWVIDPSKTRNQVISAYNNVGGSPTLLHDGFLTPDGRYFIVAAQDVNKVWILNTDTWSEVGTVETGIKPHTGPGAFAFNTIYIPSLGEGKLTAFEYGTWKVKKYIELAGPGLFVRSYNKNPDYPYVWADTAFGDHADKIYVIDARTQDIVKTLIPIPGKMTIHPEFSYDGKFVYVASSEGNKVVVYDSQTFEEVSRIESSEPSGLFNVGTRIEEPGL